MFRLRFLVANWKEEITSEALLAKGAAMNATTNGSMCAASAKPLMELTWGANRGRGISIFPPREPIVGEASAYSRRGSQSWERRQHIPAAGANRGRGVSILPPRTPPRTG
eukprot:1194466-Prorocentrum_minimum.AAC.2